jgi:endonuclease/exonuclease/phosphatase family metal-dependent hydrolase
MKIIFLNVWNFKLTNELTEFIKFHKASTDVFCFQEAYDKTRWICRDLLKDFDVYNDFKYIPNTTDSYEDEFPQATYIKKNLQINKYEVVLKDEEGTGLALHTQLVLNNKLINVCNVHGISKPGNKLDDKYRIIQSTKIIEFYKNVPGIKVIGGDFNLEKNTQSVNMFSEAGYIDLISKYKIETTRNRIVWEKYPNNILYYSDFVFTSSDCNINSFEVPALEISDHLPIVLEITA